MTLGLEKNATQIWQFPLGIVAAYILRCELIDADVVLDAEARRLRIHIVEETAGAVGVVRVPCASTLGAVSEPHTRRRRRRKQKEEDEGRTAAPAQLPRLGRCRLCDGVGGHVAHVNCVPPPL